MIDHGADVNARIVDHSSSTLEKAILSKVASQQMVNLIRGGLNYHTSINDSYHTILVFAAMYSNFEILKELSKIFSNKIADSLNKIDEILKKPWTAHVFDRDLNKDLSIKSGEVKKAKGKLLLVLNKLDSYNFAEINKEEVLSTIKEELETAKNIEACFKLYENLITSQYLNYQRYPYLDKYVLPLFISPSSYTQSKIRFIQSLQEKIYNILISSEFTNSFANSFDYYKTCKDVITHPIFGDEHEKNGVYKKYKELIKLRVDEIEKSLLITRAPTI